MAFLENEMVGVASAACAQRNGMTCQRVAASSVPYCPDTDESPATRINSHIMNPFDK
jgi:hypothetical protein